MGLVRLISNSLNFYTTKGQIKLDSLSMKLTNNDTFSNLYFSGKIVSSKYELYAISDSGHLLAITPMS